MKDLQRERGPDLPLHLAQPRGGAPHLRRVGVMYLGRLVETGATSRRCSRRRATRTRACCSTRFPTSRMTGRARTPVQGEVPNPLNPPSGCAFHPRCPHANERCKRERPALIADRRRAGRLPRGRGRADLSAALDRARRSADPARAARARRARATVSRRRISQWRVAVDHHLGRARPACCSCWPSPCRRRRPTAPPAGRLRRPPARGRGRASRPIRRPGRRRPSVGASHASRGAHGLDAHPGLVHRRAHQVVHRRVDDAEVLLAAGLAVQHLGQQHAGVADQRAAGLEQHLAMAVAAARRCARSRLRDQRRRPRAAVSSVVGDAQAAAEVEVVQPDAAAPRRASTRSSRRSSASR